MGKLPKPRTGQGHARIRKTPRFKAFADPPQGVGAVTLKTTVPAYVIRLWVKWMKANGIGTLSQVLVKLTNEAQTAKLPVTLE